MRDRSVLTAGYAALDMIVHRDIVRHRAGGTAGNVAAILAFLGWDAEIAALVGGAPAGTALSTDLAHVGVHVWPVEQPPGDCTPRVVHHVTDAGHSFRFRCPRCGRPQPRSRPLPLAWARKYLDRGFAPAVYVFDRATPGSLELAEGLAHLGSTIVFEPSVAGSALLNVRAFEVADVVKASADTEGASLVFAAPASPRQVQILTKGAGGARMRIGCGRWRSYAGYPEVPIDAGGAGDWTTAGFVHSLADREAWTEETLAAALDFGQRLAALSVRAVGARGATEHWTPVGLLDAVEQVEDGTHLPQRRPLLRADVPDG